MLAHGFGIVCLLLALYILQVNCEDYDCCIEQKYDDCFGQKYDGCIGQKYDGCIGQKYDGFNKQKYDDCIGQKYDGWNKQKYDDCIDQKCNVHVRMEAGWVRGKVRCAEDGSKYVSFRGMPYGKPPIGERRFKELEPVEPWGDFVYDAREDSFACPQDDFIYGRFKSEPKGQNEDCIYVNVHAPCEAVPKKQPGWFDTIQKGLPVLVFIHEGAFQAGSGLSDFGGPEYLLTSKMILVTFNYRLNVFGFLSLNCKEIPGNQGLRDMVTLLCWVQRNIRFFGGDPNNVTLMGHSGGGTSAHILSLSKAAKGLFKKIIAMSCNAFPAYYTASPEYSRYVAKMFLKELGINHTDPVLIHRELIQTPLVKIMAANSAVQYCTGFVSFNPCIESKFHGITRVIECDPLALIAMGRARHFPTLMSFTNNEMGFSKGLLTRKGLLSLLQHDPTAVVSMRLLYSLPRSEILKIADMIDKRYFKRHPTLDNIIKYYTDMYFKHPGIKVAEWRAAMGGAPFYMYQFAYEAKESYVKRGFWADYSGAAHFEDYLCIFRANSVLDNQLCYPPNNDDDNMKFYMIDTITNFVYCGSPTCEIGNKTWPPVSKGKIQYNLITNPFRVQMMEPTAEERDIVRFFDSFDPQVRRISAFLENPNNIEPMLLDDCHDFCDWNK